MVCSVTGMGSLRERCGELFLTFETLKGWESGNVRVNDGMVQQIVVVEGCIGVKKLHAHWAGFVGDAAGRWSPHGAGLTGMRGGKIRERSARSPRIQYLALDFGENNFWKGLSEKSVPFSCSLVLSQSEKFQMVDVCLLKSR